MNKGTKRLLGGLALAGGALGAIGAVMIRNSSVRQKRRGLDIWARPGMEVIFRAEIMPGRETSQRTFRVKELLPSGRVLLEDFAGEHVANEFERIR